MNEPTNPFRPPTTDPTTLPVPRPLNPSVPVTVPGTPPDPGIPSPVLPSTPSAPVESVARSFLFKDVVAARDTLQAANPAVPGDYYIAPGSPLDVMARRS